MDQSLLKAYISLFAILFCISMTQMDAQTYAASITSESETDNSANAIDANLLTSATIRASTGPILNIGAYSGHLELEFPSTLPSNTMSFLKLETEEDLLPSLLGGSLGNLLSDVAGTLLIGNQEFTATINNGGTTIWEEDSNDANAFSSDFLRVVTDVNNNYYLAISPNAPYNRVRLTNRIGSLIGLNNIRTLDVYGTFYGPDPATCGTPTYTSFDGSGLTLDLLNLGAGVTNPNLAIDGDLGTASNLGLGVIGVAASIEQTVYFDELSQTGDNFYIRLAVAPELLQVGLDSNIDAIAQNGSDSPIFTENLSNLLDVNLLGLLESGQPATITIDPGGAANKVTVRLSSLLNISLDQKLDLFEIYKAPTVPILDANSQDVSICEGSFANLVATTGAGNELRWYDAETGGTLLSTTNSGNPFATPALTTTTTYYVAAAKVGCPEESPRIPVTVTVVDVPTASDITITGDENPICSSNDVVLIPSSSIDGTYRWYFDNNATSEITDGLVVGSVTYTIDTDGSLIISGLDQAGSPYTYFVQITETTAGCENAAGDLQSATVTIVDSGASVSITSNPIISLNNLIDFFSGDPTYTVSGTVTGDANVGDAIDLTINGQTYSGVLGAGLDFDIDVDGSNLAVDPDGSIEVFINGGLCTLTGDIDLDIPVLVIDDLLQVFCASDNPTLLDLEVGTNTVEFFDSLDGTAILDLDTPLADGEVYFAGLLGVPTSVVARIGITVNLTDPAPPTTISITQTFCADVNATLADILLNETNVVFYADATGGTALDIATPLVNGESYFVALQDINGCESTVRLEITIVIEGTTPTTNASTQTFCSNVGATVADLQVNESNVVFYDSASGGQELDPSTPLMDATNYYASIRETSGCESPTRLQISVVLEDDEPIAITGQTEDACLNQQYTYTTESGKQNYTWTVSGGTIVTGGTATDDSVTVAWDSLQNNSISVFYDDTVGCIPSEATQIDVAVVDCGEVLGEEFCLVVYNEFTPNNDGFNDFFEVECIQDYDNTVQIFNRNGNKVFETINYQNDWNGIANVNGILSKGEHLPSGTYYYLINIPELNRNLVGWIQLAR